MLHENVIPNQALDRSYISMLWLHLHVGFGFVASQGADKTAPGNMMSFCLAFLGMSLAGAGGGVADSTMNKFMKGFPAGSFSAYNTGVGFSGLLVGFGLFFFIPVFCSVPYVVLLILCSGCVLLLPIIQKIVDSRSRKWGLVYRQQST